jgi:fructokinase
MQIVALGELLNDLFVNGVAVPGGAPANVSFHLAQLGCSSSLISAVGCDDAGDKLRAWVEAGGIDGATVQRCTVAPTGSVNVGGSVGEPLYDIVCPAAWDFIEVADAATKAARSARIIVFGTLAQRHPCSRGSIRSLVNTSAEAGALRFADLNLRPPHFDEETILWTLRHADVLKLNTDELGAVSEMLGARGSTADLFAGLICEFAIPRGVLTAGKEGAWIHERGVLTHIPAHPCEVVDGVGAGDAFTAMLLCGLAGGRSLVESAPRAARLAAWVVSSIGATPRWTPDLRRELGD